MRFHVLGLKCLECGSYNTSREGEEGVPVLPPRPTTGDQQQPDDGDEWETEEEEEIVGGEEEAGNEVQDNADGLNVSEVVLNLDGESNNE